jgi:hypothetical protein
LLLLELLFLCKCGLASLGHLCSLEPLLSFFFLRLLLLCLGLRFSSFLLKAWLD